MGLVMTACGRVIVLDAGRMIAEGPPEQIANDPAVIGAYLGA
jgi:ABC-type branched-subunit amino acid transport system ATPase component